VVDAEGAFIDTARHVDGIVDVGEGCSGCHGSPDTAAPPRDTLGRTDSGLLTVGAHRAHVLATSRLAAPIPCDECHIDPDDRDDVGHIDSPAPAEVFGAAPMRIASAGGASPAWDRATGTCANVYCHGGGPVFADDMAPGRTLTPRWTAVGLGAPGKAVCGACHGIPPLDGTHDPAAILADCADCHPTPPDRHIDGVVDVR
jgi:predicted CxxxxCH...CXXCH cytochrome family protein